MNFDIVQRRLSLADDVVDSDSPMQEQDELPMTQIPGDSSANVLISTQVQSKLDEMELKKVMKKNLTQFAFESLGATESAPPSRAATPPAKATKRKKSTKAAGRTSTGTGKKRKRTPSSIKSITQFNTENYESLADNRRSRHVVSLLSGKKKKIKDIIDRLQVEDASGSPGPSKSHFSTYSPHEWSHILQLLKSKFPKCPPGQVEAVYKYVYGGAEKDNVWYSSQMPPSDPETQASQEFHYNAQQPMVFSLSQAVEEEFVDAESPALISESFGREQMKGPSFLDEQCISDTTDETGVELKIDEDVARAFRTRMLQPYWLREDVKMKEQPGVSGDKLMKSSSGAARPKEQRWLHLSYNGVDDATKNFPKSPTSTPEPRSGPQVLQRHTYRTPSGLAGRDQLIDLTQCSFNAVKSLISPLKSEVQVPATRTTTWNDKNHSRPQNYGALHQKVQLRLCGGIADSEIYSTLRSRQVVWRLQDFDLQDSEEETKYQLLELDFETVDSKVDLSTAPHHRLSVIKSPTSIASPGDLCDFEVSVKRNASVPPSLPLSAKNLRESLRAIGLKPARTRSEMAEQMGCASQHLIGENAQEQRQGLFDQFTHLVEQSPSLLEKVYTFEPLVLSELIDFLVQKDPFIDKIDDSTIKQWADQMGICLRSAAED
ncbi:Slx4p [Lachancea thermotolerans CBS 6340]|uniref:Structure-specific endonuclease subunit SLX4 n=1 Tax=Lachancea thermotolerans (strain ATCC 56472 / CBS 6340 / NRRL Y-8284) TaxID=559295 RepID=SLX4_LACTC|nr:KLTH0G12166p [Lachancea thermotolerans CBS 6340]C5DMW3.1 RecName: Full=Structure-specific endonuclease subunit SLX4 [Lachancea thermotolerans CBS 6340]CAR25124.1 KLTH0G12166p [Lachancea thermotolerans CBS 6340]